MSAYEIPLSPRNQTFSIELGGKTYQLTFRWNSVLAAWVLDLEGATGARLLAGVPIITGADLLGQYAYLGIPGKLIVQTDHAPDVVPTFTNLGDTSHVYFVTTP